MARRLYRRSVAKGEITLLAVPSMIDEYVNMCDTVFAGLGTEFTDEQLDHLEQVLEEQLAEAYAASPRSAITISFEAPVGELLNYHVRAQWQTVPAAYEGWLNTRQPSLLGIEPDARVWALASEAADPARHRVLDIAAGSGRNALPLARRGHPVDAVELSTHFAEMLAADAARESLNLRVTQRNVFSTLEDVLRDYQLILLSDVVSVSDFRTTEQLRAIFDLAAQCLAPGGRLVFNVFLPREGYVPDDTARELGQQCYTTIFTRDELSSAAAEFPLELVADDSVYEYEKGHLPEGKWPPTSWYPDWVSGLHVFDVEREECPIEMHWLVYQKTH
jgi:SAM-dependent methyltransferase